MKRRMLLMRYVVLAVLEAKLARVPNQLVEPDSDEENDKSDSKDEVSEFSCVGAIAGYTGPLGIDPDKLGRKKNARRRRG